MASRRFGNQGSQRGGSLRSFSSTSSNISPWQGGAQPGNSNNIQTQLALALSNLLQQTQQQASDGPPSLLNMNTSPGYFTQDQYNQNRFGNRRQDFRRSEPYNKNRGGVWRSEQNRNSASNTPRGSNNYSSKPRSSSFRSQRSPPPRDQNKSKSEKRINDNSPSKQERATESTDVDRSQQIEDKTRDDKSQDDSVTSDRKRDDSPKRKSTKYDGIPKGLLHCFVCNKSMWDGESFQNHLGGKAHKQMISSLEESFQITVNILRENMRLCEERKMIELERMQRSKRYHHNNIKEPESHCNMCDLKFMGKIVVHRQTESHQRLKRFLHPKCRKCNLEFPSRMEWVDHQFSPEHLFKLKEFMSEADLESYEFKLKADVNVEMDNEPLLDENLQNEDDNPVLELNDDMTNLFNRIPVYKPDRPVGKDSLKAASGFVCGVCKLFLTEEESKKHLTSPYHYYHFVDEIKSKYQLNERKRKQEEEQQGDDENKEAIKIEDDEDDVVLPAKSEDDEEIRDRQMEEEIKEELSKNDFEMNKLLDEMYDPFGDHDTDGKPESEVFNADKSEETTPVAPITSAPIGRPKRAVVTKNANATPKTKRAKN